MPDPVLYLKAILCAAFVSVLAMLGLTWARRTRASGFPAAAVPIVAVCSGALAGATLLRLPFVWPPATALQRYLVLVLPAVALVELIGVWPRVPQVLTWALRCVLAGATVRCLLHGSVYLGDTAAAWSGWQAALVLAGCGMLGVAEWVLLAWFLCRTPGWAVPLSLAQAVLCAGLMIMLTGYLRGGEASLPQMAALVGAAVASLLLRQHAGAEATMGVGLVSLGGLLLIGRFFGGLSTAQSLVIFLAPLLSGIGEVPCMKRQPRWLAEMICLLLVAIPLLVLMALEKQRFDREMKPLLSLVCADSPGSIQMHSGSLVSMVPMSCLSIQQV